MTRQPFDPSKVRDAPDERRIVTVTEITRMVKGTIESSFPRVWVTGEISNLRRPQSGHVYLTLKDERCQLQAVMFRGVASRIRFDVADGMQVIVGGQLTVYEARGNYQIIVSSLEPVGVGALELAFRQLVEKLRKEGLFDEEHKKPIPPFPRHIGVVTSATGAAVRDILRATFKRFPGMHVTIYPVRVQGEGASAEIAEGIREMNRLGGFDVLIIGRGGGSLEDLWAFNEEVVARAIYASEIPVVSGVGHEIDVTISDMVADLRVPTPTAAAEWVVPQLEDIQAGLDDLARRMRDALRDRTRIARAELNTLAARLAPRQLKGLVRQMMQRNDDLFLRLQGALRNLVRSRRERLDGLGGRLHSLSPLAVLERGYSVTRAGRILLRRAEQAKPGDLIETILFKGKLTSRIEHVEPSDGKEEDR